MNTNKLNYNLSKDRYEIVDLTGKTYLSDWIDELPKNCIFIKGKTGVGGTTLALRSNEKYLILMPYISNVKNKMLKEEGAFIFEGDYSTFNDKVTKICATYESLPTILTLINPKEWNLVVDEYHILVNTASLRSTAVVNICKSITKFKSYLFMSATEPEFSFGLFNILKTIRFYWVGLETEIKVTKIAKFNKGLLIYKDSESTQNVTYVFCNSIQLIEDIIQKSDITNYRLICGNSATTRLKKGSINDTEAKFNFITSTGFESIDIETKADVLIYMDENKPHTLLTKNQIIQIIGRFRNGFKSLKILSKKGNILYKGVDVEAAKEQLSLLDTINELIQKDKTFGAYKAKVFSDMYDYILIVNNIALFNYPKFWAEYYVEKVIDGYTKLDKEDVIYKGNSFTQKSKVSLPELIQDIDNHTDSKYYNIIKRCIANIGIENTKSLSIKQIKKYASNGLTFEQIKCSLGYRNNQFVSCKQIKSDLKELDIRGKITEFYYCKPAIKKIKGKTVRGYVF